jgi:hypothetical protein
MSISQVRQELLEFCNANPQPVHPTLHEVWVSNYAQIYAKYPWYYKLWAEFAGRYMQANSWYLRCGTENLIRRLRHEPVEVRDEY